MTAAFLLTGIVAFSVYAVFAMRSEEEDLTTTAQREFKLLARSLQVSIENALRDAQDRDIAETLTRLEHVDPDVDVSLHGLDGQIRATSDDSLSAPELEGRLAILAMATNDAVVRFEPEGALERLIIALPIRADDGEVLGALTLAKPLERLVADLKSTQRTIWISLIGFLLASVAVGFGLGSFFIGRPMARVLAAIDGVRDGETRVDLPTRRPDEIGMTARAFERLINELARERNARESETRRRRELERELEHADKLIAVGRLSARIAHEVGSPLQVLVGRAQAIVALPDVGDKVARHATIIAEQGARVTGILRELLSWTQPAVGPPRPVDPGAEVEAISDLLELELRHRGVVLAVSIERPLPPVSARPGQMQQVVLNLVKNALLVSPSGSTIAVTVTPHEASAIALTVSDEGPGIPPEHLARLFEPFFTTRLDDGGVGLGLTVVRGIVEEHGGHVEVVSGAKAGTRFIVLWPADDKLVRRLGPPERTHEAAP